jgi:hypothetical protein
VWSELELVHGVLGPRWVLWLRSRWYGLRYTVSGCWCVCVGECMGELLPHIHRTPRRLPPKRRTHYLFQQNLWLHPKNLAASKPQPNIPYTSLTHPSHTLPEIALSDTTLHVTKPHRQCSSNTRFFIRKTAHNPPSEPSHNPSRYTGLQHTSHKKIKTVSFLPTHTHQQPDTVYLNPYHLLRSHKTQRGPRTPWTSLRVPTPPTQ